MADWEEDEELRKDVADFYAAAALEGWRSLLMNPNFKYLTSDNEISSLAIHVARGAKVLTNELFGIVPGKKGE